MLFRESKKKNDEPIVLNNQEKVELKPAWVDKSLSKSIVQLDNSSRLRKLKKSEGESEIRADQFQKRLKDQHSIIMNGGQASAEIYNWAIPSSNVNNDSAFKESLNMDLNQQQDNIDLDPIAKLLQSNQQIFQKSVEVLRPGKIHFQKLINANFGHQHESIVSSIQFHPNENILMTSGLDRKVKLFNVSHSESILQNIDKPSYNNVQSSQKQKKIQSIFLPDLPVYAAKFIQEGLQAVLTGNRKHFYSYDIPTNKVQRYTAGQLDQKNLSNLYVSQGQHNKSDYMCITSKDSGEANMFSQKSKKLLYSLKMNGSCNSVCFSPNDLYMFTVGDQAEIYQWDLRQRRCIYKVSDEGSFNSTCIDMSADGNWIATGSKMGTINIYSLHKDIQSNQNNSVLFNNSKPEKTIMNLTTSITDLKFGPTSQVLAYCSKWKKNALRLVHLPSFTAYQNFPGAAPGILKYPICLGFNNSGEYLAMGNDEGKAHLWHMPYFSSKSMQ